MKKIDAEKLDRYFDRMRQVVEDNPPQTEKGRFWYEGYITAIRTAQSYADALAEKETKKHFFS